MIPSVYSYSGHWCILSRDFISEGTKYYLPFFHIQAYKYSPVLFSSAKILIAVFNKMICNINQ